MTTKAKSTTVEGRKPDGNHANPEKLVFPADPTGFTSMLRKEGTRAVGRLNGSADKMQVFMDTLRVLAQHAEVKVKAQVVGKADEVARAAALSALEAIRVEADRVADVARLTVHIANTQKTLDAKIKADPSKAVVDE
jgi:hypothetical protein